MPLWGRAPRARLNELNELNDFYELKKLRRKRISVTRSDTPLRGAADWLRPFWGRSRILCASHKTAARFGVAQLVRGSSAPVAQ